jgi:DNA-binding transcriptional ArsR family regulator
LSHALAAVAHPVRRDLLARVREQPVRVTDLAAGFDISLPAVSRHLKVLESAGLVTRSIVGRDHFIAASEPGWRSVALWVRRESVAWERRLGALKTMLEAGDGGA